MRAVLGVDAAWTVSEPSGVALAVETNIGWQLRAVEASYENFSSLVDPTIGYKQRPSGSIPSALALLTTASALVGYPVTLVAIDMPLAHSRIEKRRCADNRVSEVYGGRWCGTHSPSGLRPGQISDALRRDFMAAGYPLCTTEICVPGIIEVYPHPALVELTGAQKRLPYKVAKTKKYWPELDKFERERLLLTEWTRITTALEPELQGVVELLPSPSDREISLLKAYEDKLDAVVCCWVAICALKNWARAFGDTTAAIWVPAAPAVPGGT